MRKKAFYDNISHVINTYIKKINSALRDFLTDTNRRYSLRLISDALLLASKDFILRKGKRVRPLLFVLSYKGYTGRKSYSDKRLFTSAAAIELLHDFMLIHDDVIDNSSLRRGKPTLHKIFDRSIRLPDKALIGESLAIVAGDILFALAIESLLSINESMNRKENALRNLVQTAAYTGAGEFIDVVFGHRTIDQLSEQDIFLAYTLKTAKYTFECPLLMGAILAGTPDQELKKLSQLGLAAGQAFQIYDDFLNLFASKKTIGKPILTDLTESKKTLLVFKAYKNSGRNEKKRFRKIFEKKTKTLSDLDALRRIVIKSGSYDYCLKKMSSLQEKATRLCNSLKMKKAYKKALEYVIFKLSPSSMPFNP
ncbi:MAG: hypothetical protein AUJ74_07190 [Candidatus Omnitrophica bacterium CG1_02_44_16]|nr:MAG: hypothetical protein AUJ74_07190 [Candidatus Omnitrophica bacterium CG1_02_44_16]PIY82276.1 MAG: hypothetical protein COY78_07515 [Candidatus Omnitrophica bacterium CG_4_10_14_0_8_um_filter_44_12]PIZ83676.1 MAG: hypothetical protein COX96_07275 [Candidatus Omnitrophica bacterium CG_4_10_14_0_2_um_filter_44_9]